LTIRRNANGVKHKSRIIDGENHRGKPSNKRYAIIPARAISDPRLAPYDMLVLATLGLFVSRSGVSFPTYETIRAYTGLSRVSINACLKRLVMNGLIRKLQQKRYPSQTSKWLTNRYQVMFKADDPIPTDEDLIASIPFATDGDEIIDKSAITNSIQTEKINPRNDKTQGIERDVRSVSQTYGINITIDDNSLNTLAEMNASKDQIALAFRSHLSRFGSLPPSLAVLIQRGCFA
jgi:hypothetical protein